MGAKKTGHSAIVAAVVALMFLASAGGIYLLVAQRGDLTKLIPRKDPDKVKVEKWLRENLDSGKWEEVQWWPAVDLKSVYDEKCSYLSREMQAKDIEITRLSDEIADFKKRGVVDTWGKPTGFPAPSRTPDEQALWGMSHEKSRLADIRSDFSKELELVKSRGIRRLCGMKYRTSNKMGARVIQEELFEVSGDALRIPFDPRGNSHEPDGLNFYGWHYLRGDALPGH